MTSLPGHSPTAMRIDQLLTRYRAWADDLTYDLTMRISECELGAARQTTFGSIGHTLQHMYIVDDIFRAHVEGRPHGYTARTVENLPPVSQMRASATEMNQWWINLSDQSSEADLNRPLTFNLINGDACTMTRQEIILHLVQHATYHRGYVDDMMYEVPITPPATDLTVFLQKARQV